MTESKCDISPEVMEMYREMPEHKRLFVKLIFNATYQPFATVVQQVNGTLAI